MKKKFKVCMSLLLSALLICSTFMFAAAAAGVQETPGYNSVEEYIQKASVTPASAKTTADNADSGKTSGIKSFSDFVLALKKFFAKLLNALSDLIINNVICRTVANVIPGSKALEDYNTYNLSEYGNFYEGTESFIDEPAENAVWSLGYGEESVTPADLGEKSYAKGAYLPYIFGNAMYTDESGTAEELRARAIVLNDGSNRGSAVFAVIDCMGLCNADVRLIREALADFAAENNIVSINVSATHIHTGIDSQGVWSDPAGCLFNNISGNEVKYGVDRTFLNTVIEGTKNAVIEAYNDMKTGTLYYSSTDISDYVWDRTAPIALDPNLYKLEFVPSDVTATPTIVASFGCHPESSSYDWKTTDENGKTVYDEKFSSDFIWYMEKVMNAAGYNFLYIQGDVNTSTSGRTLSNDGLGGDAHYSAVRYGHEMGYIALTMNMTREERIAVNNATGDFLGVNTLSGRDGYSVWYDGLNTAERQEVEPVLNIRMKQFFVEIENYAMVCIGKTSIADNLVLTDGKGSYYTVTEVGYMEIGTDISVYLSPGETFAELLIGGEGLNNFPYECIRDKVGENCIVFDLMNDAAGYVANDSNFVMVGLQYNETKADFDSDTWCIISYGPHTASTFIGQFYSVVDSVR